MDNILEEIPEIRDISSGLLHLFIKHTSASLTINEDADPTVREDLETHFNIMVPENASYYRHKIEGSDDIPAHLKSAILGLRFKLQDVEMLDDSVIRPFLIKNIN